MYPPELATTPTRHSVHNFAQAFGISSDLLIALLCEEIIVEQPDELIFAYESDFTELLMRSPHARRVGDEIILSRRPNLRLLPCPSSCLERSA